MVGRSSVGLLGVAMLASNKRAFKALLAIGAGWTREAALELIERLAAARDGKRRKTLDGMLEEVIRARGSDRLREAIESPDPLRFESPGDRERKLAAIARRIAELEAKGLKKESQTKPARPAKPARRM